MTLLDALRSGLAAIAAQKLRSGLTMLGLIIGVAAVIATFAIGVGAQTRIDGIIQALGANVIVMWGGTPRLAGVRGISGEMGRLSERDVAALQERVDGALVVAPMVQGPVQVIAGALNWSTRVNGVGAAFFLARDWDLASGRLFTQAEERPGDKLAILGATVAKELFGESDPVGAVVRIKRVPFEVIGVMRPKGLTMFGGDMDDVVFTPLDAARIRLLGRTSSRPDQVDSITVKAVSAEALDLTEAGIRRIMDERRPGAEAGEAYNLRNQTQFLEAQTSAARTMSRLLGIVATIALVVGGIGIMNIMLVSVSERTREIGLRMAVGARRRDIRLQFLAEAVALALGGGLIGIAIGIAASAAVAHFAGWPLLVAPWVVATAFLFSAAVGIFFGWWPAAKASRLDPIEALRAE